tara:strand:- start:541 stop:1038 length:498 start_codon:yes stop_codon:yes gene_type:complete
LSDQKIAKHTISVLVNDEPGALARVIGLFSGRGYNIDSLTVAPVNLEKKHSRIIIVTSGSQKIIDQIISSLERLIQVHKVIDLSSKNSTDERELGMVKVSLKQDKINDAKNIARKYKAKLIFKNSSNLAFEITDSPDNINKFIIKLNDLGKIDVSRTGLIAILKD